jgi:hypothetical protein
MDKIDLWRAFPSPDDAWAVVFEDNGRVAYAYLFDDASRIRADVWLYNRCAAPAEPEWTNPLSMPFANPQRHARDLPPDWLPASADDVAVQWYEGAEGWEPEILVRGQRLARLAVGANPGWSMLATLDGPLALVWDAE